MRTQTRPWSPCILALLAVADVARAAPPSVSASASEAEPAVASAAPAPRAARTAAASGESTGGAAPAKTPARTPARVAAPRTPPAAAKKAEPSRAAQQRSAEQALSSDDPAAVRNALSTLGGLGGERAATVIAARVRRGLPPKLIDPAIAALVQIGKPSAGPVLLELTLHRRPQIRAQAVAALGALKIRSAQSSLLYALDDPSPEVRVAAVSALGVVGTSRALPALLTSADRGVDHVFDAYGAIARPQDEKPILERARGGQLMLVAPALRAMLLRSNFSQRGKLDIVKQVAEIGSADARACLDQWLEALPKQGGASLRRALTEAIKKQDSASPTGARAPAAASSGVAAASAKPQAAAPAGGKP